MKKKAYITGMILVAGLMMAVVFGTSYITAGFSNTHKAASKLKKPDIVDQAIIAQNNWAYSMQNQGVYMYDAQAGNAGGEFPRGSGLTIVFSGGFMIGGLKELADGTKVPAVSASEPSGGGTSYRPGRITNSGVAYEDLTFESPDGAEQQVYVIDRSASGSDYANWPLDAPRTSSNNPGLIADAQSWAVFNDRNFRELSQYTPNPDAGFGLQVALESFVFNAGPLSNVVYLKFNIANKSNSDVEQTYLSIYMDPDVYNNGVHDLAGVDVSKGLAFVYNSPSGTASPWAAVGLDYFQGPVVRPTDIPENKRVEYVSRFGANKTILQYDPSENRYIPVTLTDDRFVLGATGFINFKRGEEADNDVEKYNVLQGLNKDGTELSGTGRDQIYAWPGDPLNPADLADPSKCDPDPDGDDQRILHVSGPFTLKAGETQEVWVGVIGGTSTTSRLNALQQVYDTDVLAQSTFTAGLVAPAPPLIPEISVTGLDGKAVITWQNNAEYTEDKVGEILQIDVAHGYSVDYLKNDFQGYRVYKSRTGLPGSYEMLAQYDLADGITTVVNRSLNQNAVLEIHEIKVGDDTGLQYSYVDEDVVNGQTYFYSVTAYDAQPYIANTATMYDHPDFGQIPSPSGLPISLETAQTANVTSIVPMKPVLGSTHSANVGQVEHTGPSDGSISIEIVDPSKITDRDFVINFISIPPDSDGANLVGSEFLPAAMVVYQILADDEIQTIESRADDPRTFYDGNANGVFDEGDIKLDDSKFGVNQASAADEASIQPIIVNGLAITVYGPALDAKDFLIVANAAGPLNPPSYGAFAFNGSGFPSVQPGFDPANQIGDRPTANSQTNGTRWGIHVGGGTGPYNDHSGTSFVDRVFRGSNFSRFVPYDFELRFTAAGGQGNFFFTSGNQAAVPFEIWNIGIGTPGDPSDDYRMYPRINDAGGATDVWDITATDHPISGGDNDPITDWIYFMNPTDVSPGQAGYNAAVAAGDGATGVGGEVMARVVLVGFNAGSVADGTFPANLVATQPEVGTVFRIISTKPNTIFDQYTFTTNGASQITAKKELKKLLKDIKVVPNPYFGRSSYQQSLYDKTIKFTNLPDVCTIRIFTVAGDLVDVINHNASSDNDRVSTNPLDLTFEPNAGYTSTERWSLQNTGNKYIASGMYVALIEAPGIGKTTVKFAVIQEEVEINGLDQR